MPYTGGSCRANMEELRGIVGDDEAAMRKITGLSGNVPLAQPESSEVKKHYPALKYGITSGQEKKT